MNSTPKRENYPEKLSRLLLKSVLLLPIFCSYRGNYWKSLSLFYWSNYRIQIRRGRKIILQKINSWECGRFSCLSRIYAHSSLFAFMKQYESEGTCSGPLTEICLKRKIEFRKWNQTHLMIKIYDVTISDSGLYKVWARFRGLQTDEKTKKCLQVIHLEKKGRECFDILKQYFLCGYTLILSGYRSSSGKNEISASV